MNVGKAIMILVLAGLIFVCSGCNHPSTIVTPGVTSLERSVQVKRVQVLRDDYLQEDIDVFFLIDKPSNLTKYHIR